jgi:hypothetical protein
MKIMRSTARYSSLDHRRNDILQDPVEKKLKKYKQKKKYLNHVSRMKTLDIQNSFTIDLSKDDR